MGQFFRLSTSELASILELVVDVPDHLSVGNRYLNEVKPLLGDGGRFIQIN
jgi:hypothetical protein